MFRADVWYLLCKFDEFLSSIIWLNNKAFPSFQDVMFESDVAFQTEFFPNMTAQFNSVIVD